MRGGGDVAFVNIVITATLQMRVCDPLREENVVERLALL
jgi:hypothetical protein